MKIVKKVVLIILSILLALLFTYNVYAFVCRKIFKKSFATINGYATLEVVTGSMEPTLQVGDIIIIDTKVKDYKKGNIVTFLDTDGTYVTHRLLSINEKEMVTKGDHNNTQDKPADPKQLVGKYVFKIKKGQKIFSSLKNPLVIILILVNGILFSIFVSIDKHGDIKLDAEEKEYVEFKNYLDKKKNK